MLNQVLCLLFGIACTGLTQKYIPFCSVALTPKKVCLGLQPPTGPNDLEPKSIRVYLEVSPVIGSEAYPQVTVDRIGPYTQWNLPPGARAEED